MLYTQFQNPETWRDRTSIAIPAVVQMKVRITKVVVRDATDFTV